METKTCTKCKEEKHFDMFRKNKLGKNGLCSYCKNCSAIYNTKYRIENYEKEIIRQKKYRDNNREKRRESIKKSKDKHKDKVLKKNKEYKDNNKDRILEFNRNSAIELSDRYIKAKLKKQGFTTDQIKENPELIEVKRIITKTKRLCKTSQI